VLATSALITGAALIVLLAVPTDAGALVGTLMFGCGICWPGVVQAKLMDDLSADGRGFGFGLLRTVYMSLAASGSVVFGVLTDFSEWGLGYGAVIGLLGSCLAAIIGNAVRGRLSV